MSVKCTVAVTIILLVLTLTLTSIDLDQVFAQRGLTSEKLRGYKMETLARNELSIGYFIFFLRNSP